MAQVVEPSKCEAQSSNPSTTTKTKQTPHISAFSVYLSLQSAHVVTTLLPVTGEK
jgi:hypothetical protein